MPLRLAPALPAQPSLNAAGRAATRYGSPPASVSTFARCLARVIRTVPFVSRGALRRPRRIPHVRTDPGEGAVERRQAHSSLPSRLRGAISRACEARTVPLQPGRPLGAPPWRFSAGDPCCRLRQWGTGADQRPACARPYGPAGGIPDLPRRGSLRRRRTPLPAPPAGSSPETPLMSEDANLCSIGAGSPTAYIRTARRNGPNADGLSRAVHAPATSNA